MTNEQQIKDAESHVQSAQKSLEAAQATLQKLKDTSLGWWVGEVAVRDDRVQFTPYIRVPEGTALNTELYTIAGYGATGNSCVILRGRFTPYSPVKIGV